MAAKKKGSAKKGAKKSRTRKQRADEEDDEDQDQDTSAVDEAESDTVEDDADESDTDDDEETDAGDLEDELDRFEGMSDRKTRPKQIVDRDRDGMDDEEERKLSGKEKGVSMRIKPSTTRRRNAETREEAIERLDKELARLRADKPEEGDPVEVIVYAKQMAFDGVRRIRRGTRLDKVSVPTNAESGEPILARWMATPKEWKTLLRREVAEDAEQVKSRKVRGGATGMQEL